MTKRILILDGDSIAYRCSAAGEQRGISVLHEPTGIVKVFKHRTAFKELMQSKNKEITEDYVVTDTQEPEPLEYVLSTIKKHITRIAEEVNADEIKVYAGEKDNFRLKLNLPKLYKGNRSSNIRPVHLAEAKKYLKDIWFAEESVGIETDDSCCIAAYDALAKGHLPLQYYYEKDQLSLDSITLLMEDNESINYVLVPEHGELHLDKTSVKGLGLKFLCYQWVCSDPVDNYCAYDLSKVKFGAKSAYKLLADTKTPQETLLAVVEQFKKFYPDKFEYTDWNGQQHEADYVTMLDLYYRCARMMRSKDDALDFRLLLDKHGVTL
jgi:hypothetical protein